SDVVDYPGQWVADIGAGGGFFTFRFAEAVGEDGRVFAVDTDKELLDFIRRNAAKKGLSNVQVVHASKDEVPLPKRSLDLIFMRNVYHHIEDRVKYARRLKRLLKPGGKVAIIEYREARHPLLFHSHKLKHYVPREEIIREMEEAGYRKHVELEFLPDQSFIIFTSK
ncbi:MAG: class I SAM-dependent methyltransferase, partial [Candidatus Freyarchaeota archaeon]|nr:class I SAM-dependent methyltransferase [Candidatus Jordarchaeia archaeon]